MNKNLIVASCFLALFAVRCGGEVDDPENIGIDQDEFSDGAGPLRGHKDVLRFSIEFANSLLKSEHGITQYYSPVPDGGACDSSHTICTGTA